MQTLPTSFRFDDFDFNQLARQGDVALFQKTKPWRKVPEFEVVLVQTKPEEVIFGKLCPLRETMPATSEFGHKGWSFIDRRCAKDRFSQLVTLRNSGVTSKRFNTPVLVSSSLPPGDQSS